MGVKLHKQFKDFHDTIKLDKESSQLKEKREILQSDIESKLPEKLESIGIKITKSDLHFFDQGSYRQNVSTGIKSVTADIEVLPLSLILILHLLMIQEKSKNVYEML